MRKKLVRFEIMHTRLIESLGHRAVGAVEKRNTFIVLVVAMSSFSRRRADGCGFFTNGTCRATGVNQQNYSSNCT